MRNQQVARSIPAGGFEEPSRSENCHCSVRLSQKRGPLLLEKPKLEKPTNKAGVTGSSPVVLLLHFSFRMDSKPAK